MMMPAELVTVLCDRDRTLSQTTEVFRAQKLQMYGSVEEAEMKEFEDSLCLKSSLDRFNNSGTLLQRSRRRISIRQC